MGTDKASLVVDGITMRDRVVAAVAAAGVATVVVAGTTDVPDARASNPEAHGAQGSTGTQGPLAGIVGAWQTLRSRSTIYDPVVVLACDLPWLVPEVIAELLALSAQHQHGAVAHDGERPQPLVAAYRPIALDAMIESFDAGERSLRRCSADWDLGVVAADPAVVADADRPEDLAGFTVQWPL